MKRIYICLSLVMLLLANVETKRRVLLTHEQEEELRRGLSAVASEGAHDHMNPSMTNNMLNTFHNMHLPPGAGLNTMNDPPLGYDGSKDIHTPPGLGAKDSLIHQAVDSKYMRGPASPSNADDTRGPPVPIDMSKMPLPHNGDIGDFPSSRCRCAAHFTNALRHRHWSS